MRSGNFCIYDKKQQEISSRRSAYEVYHIFLAFFSWYPKNPEAKNGVESENWSIEQKETFLQYDLINTIKLTGLYQKKYFSTGC